jgi:hypothetical protein
LSSSLDLFCDTPITVSLSLADSSLVCLTNDFDFSFALGCSVGIFFFFSSVFGHC